MWQFWVTWIGTGGVAIWLGFQTWVKNRGDRDLADDRMNLDVIKETVDTLVDEVARLKTDLSQERDARAEADLRAREAEQRALAAERRAQAARRVTTRLMRRVQQLEKALRSAHIDVPAEQPHDLEPDLD